MKRIRVLMDIKGVSALEVIWAVVILFIIVVILAAVAKSLIKWALIVGVMYLIARYILGIDTRNG